MPLFTLLLALALGLSLQQPARAESPDVAAPPPADDALAPGATVSGEELFRKLLDNRKPAAVRHQRVLRTDANGVETETVLSLRVLDLAESAEEAPDGVVSKALIKFSEPLDARNNVILIVNKADGDTEEFIYTADTRKARRVSLGAQSPAPLVRLTSIGIERIEQATYRRLPDEELDGTPVHVVEASFSEGPAKTITYMTRDHYVPLRVVFFDGEGNQVAEQKSDPASVKQLDGVWIATRTTIESPAGPVKVTIEGYERELDVSESLFTPNGMGRLRTR